MNCTKMHGSTNIKFTHIMFINTIYRTCMTCHVSGIPHRYLSTAGSALNIPSLDSEARSHGCVNLVQFS